MAPLASTQHSLESKAHILYIDDEKSLLEINQWRIEQLGYQITAYTDSLQALSDFQKAPDRYHAVITDLSMPDLDGVKLSEKIAAIKPGIPIILCTADYTPYSEDQIHASGIDRILIKPVSKKKLAHVLNQLLR